MSSVYLIRHGQAGPRYRYDALSELGRKQSALLGEYFADQRMEFKAIYAGALARQQETAEAVVRAYGARGMRLPEVATDADWNEFDLTRVYEDLAPVLAAGDPEFRVEHEAMQQVMADETHAIHRSWSRCDVLVVRAWVEGRIPCRTESWNGFRERVSRALARLERFASGESVAIFTSATPIAVWAGLALGLDDARVMRLAGVMYNSAITSLRLRDGELYLVSFNGVPHLSDAGLRTFR